MQAETMNLVSLLQDYERALIVHALRTCGGNQRNAARLLGIIPSTLSEKMRRLGLRARRGAWLARLPIPAGQVRVLAREAVTQMNEIQGGDPLKEAIRG